uniref:Uncharacterized protein n=1 Tax=Arundo donax TaxID=35708 RepID=A0A0A9F679_ARUDO
MAAARADHLSICHRASTMPQNRGNGTNKNKVLHVVGYKQKWNGPILLTRVSSRRYLSPCRLLFSADFRMFKTLENLDQNQRRLIPLIKTLWNIRFSS